MISHKVSYTNFNNELATEELFLNLNKSELLVLMEEYGGNMQDYLQKILDKNDPIQLMNFIGKMIDRAYGEKSLDGTAFLKTEEIKTKWQFSTAREQFINELLYDNQGLSVDNFMAGLMNLSAEERKEYDKLVAEKGNSIQNDLKNPVEEPATFDLGNGQQY